MVRTDKFIIAKYIDDHKADIIQKYASDMSIADIAEYYGVALSTISIRLNRWGVKVKRFAGPKLRAIERPLKFKVKAKISPELLAKREENTRINDDYFKRRRFELGLTNEEEQKLVTEVTKEHPIGEV